MMRFFPLLVLGLVGCGDDGTPADTSTPVDGTVDGSEAFTIAAPDIPWIADGIPPLSFTPCPDSYREVTDAAGISICDPYPEGGPSACSDGEAHFVGEAGCRPIGTACPASGFATDLPTDSPVIYVDAGAASGGDGTEATPHDALSRISWSSLTAGTTVALATGTYEGTLPLKGGVTVVGACVAETILSGLSAPVAAVVTVTTSGEATVRNLTIADAPQTGVLAQNGRTLRVEGVRVLRATGLAVAADGATVVARDLVVESTRTTSGGTQGYGLFAQAGGSVEATGFVVVDNTEAGAVAINADSTLVLSDGIVLSTRSRADRQVGRGIFVVDESRVEATRVHVRANRDIGIAVSGTGTTAVLTDVTVSETMPVERDGNFGRGVNVEDGATLTATRLAVFDNHEAGLVVRETAAATLEDVVIRDIVARERDMEAGNGIQVQLGGRLTATGLVVSGVLGAGVLAGGEGVIVSLTDALITGTLPFSHDETGGVGLDARDGASVTLSRSVLSDNRQVGLLVSGAGTVVTADDAVIEHTLAQQSDGLLGRGVNVQNGARLTATRLSVDDSRDFGVLAIGADAFVTLNDATVRGTAPRDSDDAFGHGVVAQRGAGMAIDGLDLDGASEIGLMGLGGSMVVARRLRVRNVDPSASDVAERTLGYGAAAVGGSLDLTDFEVANATNCGLFLAPDPAGSAPMLDARDGRVSGGAIGACIQVDGYDLSRVQSNVRYSDNGTSLQATSLPTPAGVDGVTLSE